jgi:argininosuccinate lyase
MKMWSGRFQGETLDANFETWQRSFPFDRRLIPYEVAASKAHARALRSAGVLNEEELAAILGGLDTIARRAAEEPGYLDDTDLEVEDVHHFVERELVAAIGETGLKLHTGRSRNEQIATDLRLFVRAAIDELGRALADLLRRFLQQAEQAGPAAMPAYTHMQRAEPVLVAHWLLAFAEMFLRDAERLGDCRERVNLCPLGSGALAGATLALDREGMAANLGFRAPAANSIDATSDRDFALEFVQHLSLLAVHLSRWAEEMLLFSTQEYGFVRLPAAFSTGSSAMPQKKNPDSLELIRSKAGRVIGAATTLLVVTKGLPLAYDKDMQETQEPVFEATETVLSAVRVASGFMAAVEFDWPRMQAAASRGFLNAMAAATYLVRRGVPFRRAHEQVGKAVQYCLEKGCELENLGLDELRRFSPEFGEDVYGALTLAAVLDCHDVPGGTAPQRVQPAIAALREKIAKLGGRAHAHA